MNQLSQTVEQNPEEPSTEPSIDKKKLFWFVFAFLIILAGSIYGIFALVKAGPQTTSQVRDIFIIVLAFESLLIGIVLVILVVQLALLTNMLQNEIKPILSDAKETVDTVKGTANFLSKRAVSPVIKANSYVAGAKRLFELLGILK